MTRVPAVLEWGFSKSCRDGLKRGALWALLVVAVASGNACVTVTLYEPMGVLQRPTVVDAGAASFTETRIQLRCLPSNDLPAGDAEKLCRFLSTSLREQGAETETVVPRQPDDAPSSAAFDGAGADLSIEIVSATEHNYDYPLLGTLSCLTCTTIPSVVEETYRQHIVVRGRNQAVLAEETLRARFVSYNSFVVWGVNYIFDWLFRDDDNDLSGDLGFKAFSRDFYRQTSQLAFNARVRSDLLGLTTRSARPLSAVPTGPVPAPTTTAPTTTAPTATAPTATAPTATATAPTTTAPTTTAPTAAPPPPPPPPPDALPPALDY